MKKTFAACALIIVVGIAVFFKLGKEGVKTLQQANIEQGTTELRYTEIDTDFIHTSDFKVALPFMGLSAIDVNNDGVDEIFVGGGMGQQDAILVYDGSVLATSDYGASISKQSDDPTYGAMSIDATSDGLADLFVARESGVYFYKNTGTGFECVKLDFPLDEKSMPLSMLQAISTKTVRWIYTFPTTFVRNMSKAKLFLMTWTTAV